MDNNKTMKVELPESAVLILSGQYMAELVEMWDVFKHPSKALYTDMEYISCLDDIPDKLDMLKDASTMLIKIRLWQNELDPNDIVLMTNEIYDALKMHTIGVQTGGERRVPTRLEAIYCNELLARIREDSDAFRAFCDMNIDESLCKGKKRLDWNPDTIGL